MGKASAGRTYEDFRVGDRVECPGPRVLQDAERDAWIQLTGAPGARFGLGEQVHPMLVLALAHGQVARELHSHLLEELGASGVVFHRPVRPGTILRCTARVVGLRADPDQRSGVVWVRVAARDARGVVLSYVCWFRVARKHRQSEVQPDTLPRLGDGVPLTELYTKTLRPTPRHESGGRFAFDDFVTHETLMHRGTARIAPGDIPRMARWLRLAHPQHHDPEHASYAAPLPQVTGLAYSLAHDGLEDRLGLGAINALRTPNRLVDGDRLYAMSQVAAVEPISDQIGAVRLRTFLFRGHDPSLDEKPAITDGKRYLPHIALDMDYWELLPTRKGLRQ
jgi:2-methylfumaryl-CoA hydratase